MRCTPTHVYLSHCSCALAAVTIAEMSAEGTSCLNHQEDAQGGVYEWAAETMHICGGAAAVAASIDSLTDLQKSVAVLKGSHHVSQLVRASRPASLGALKRSV